MNPKRILTCEGVSGKTLSLSFACSSEPLADDPAPEAAAATETATETDLSTFSTGTQSLYPLSFLRCCEPDDTGNSLAKEASERGRAGFTVAF